MTDKLKEMFIREFCNDHNGEVRFMRGIFYDEKDGAERIIDFLETAGDQVIAEAEKKLLRTLLTECDRTENEGGRLLVTAYILKVKKNL